MTARKKRFDDEDVTTIAVNVLLIKNLRSCSIDVSETNGEIIIRLIDFYKKYKAHIPILNKIITMKKEKQAHLNQK